MNEWDEYHDAGLHHFATGTGVFDAEVTQTLVQEPTLLLPHFTLRIHYA